MPLYAVHKGYSTGVFTNWNDCKKSIDGYKNAVFKKFMTEEDAQEFVKNGNNFIENILSNEQDFNPDITVFTDGACSNNGKPNAKAGIGIFFSKDDPRNYSSKIEGKQSNNCAEIKAIIEAYRILKNDIKSGKKVLICSDSEYAMKCCTTYGKKCEEKEWDNEIPNIELIKIAYELFKNKKNIQFKYVKAHTDKNDPFSIGNDGADKLANIAIGLNSCPYNSSKNIVNENLNKNENKVDIYRIYLDVKYDEKDQAKALGARWDVEAKKWYIFSNLDNKFKELLFEKFNKI
jgi:ribonuclease HI